MVPIVKDVKERVSRDCVSKDIEQRRKGWKYLDGTPVPETLWYTHPLEDALSFPQGCDVTPITSTVLVFRAATLICDSNNINCRFSSNRTEDKLALILGNKNNGFGGGRNPQYPQYPVYYQCCYEL